MSGGVDSAVAAYLLRRQNVDCAGVTMKLFDNAAIGLGHERACCSLTDANDARSVADMLGIPFYVMNCAADFKQQVIDRFVQAYRQSETPNPCIDCNRHMKFEKLLSHARLLGMDYLATGHYARVEQDAETGRYLLKKAKDATKDQSYVLYTLTQAQLAHVLFPLGGLTKAEARAIAARQCFANAGKPESQDICFVREGGYAAFIERYTGEPSLGGPFVDTQGRVLGRHNGLIRYTIGQRKGLGVSFREPLFVCAKNSADNTVTLCTADELFAASLETSDFNWVCGEAPAAPLRVMAKIRYNQQAQWATATQKDPQRVRVVFDEPQRAIAKGQAVVLYDGDRVLGGGTIA